MKEEVLAWVLGALAPLASAAAQSALMPTEVHSLDGNQRDLAVSHADVTTIDPAAERLLLAQGRRLAEHFVSTRERQFLGELTDFPTDIAAVEVDEARELMFVLTNNTITGTGTIAGELRVYDISTASSPQLTDTEQVTGADIRVIPQDQKLLLIQTQKVIVYDYAGSTSLTSYRESETLTTAALSVTCGTEPARDVTGLARAVVEARDDGTRRVYFVARMEHNRVPLELFKGASGIIALNLTGYPTTPTFYDHVFDAYPCPAPTDPVMDPPSKWAVRDLAIATIGSQKYLCAVGAEEFQLKIFRITNFPVDGFDYYAEKDFDLGPGNDLESVDIVGSSPTKLVILSRHYSIAAEIGNANNFVTVNTPFGDGPFRDTLLMKEGSSSSPQTKLWSVTGLGTDYRFKIQDVTLLLPELPDLQETYYSPGDSDTSVYIPEFDSVYCTNFNGLVRYDVSIPPDAVPDYDSYIPAVDSSSGRLLPIEHMIGAKRLSGAWQLFGNAAVGGFFQWEVDATTHDPQLIAFIDGVEDGAWPSWASDPDVTTYGQDVEYGIDPNNGHEIIVIDYYNWGTKQIAINVYDLTDSEWGTYLVAPSQIQATSWDLTLDGRWVFVGGEGGFFVAELVANSGPSTLALRSTRLTMDQENYPAGPVGGYSFQQVRGIARRYNRVFVSLSDHVDDNVNRFAVAMYSFDPTPGSAGGTIGSTPIAALFDGAESQPDDFPDPDPVPDPFAGSDPEFHLFVTGGGRLRAFTDGDQTQLFSGTQNGFVLQMSYSAQSDTLTSDPLRFWHNNAFYLETSDCQVSNLAAAEDPPDLRLTISKWTETFAIVEPFPFD